ncbi:MAG TPA: ATP-binding protein [Turneriella sp.]|nr:ATP-binding protein [Turneriella sp.]HNL53844.1 ATP-binding protein [Turneriella sp.]HNM99141.1 ATP-binding protein [Turneriella sp.]
MPKHQPLSESALYRKCDPELIPFANTGEVAVSNEIFGQKRALDAIAFGTSIDRAGYNIFVLGENGSGRHSAVQRILIDQARQNPSPQDVCYVHNFADANQPRLLLLPAGRGVEFRNGMQQFVSELPKAITAAFESEEHRREIEAIIEEFRQREETALTELGRSSSDKGIALLRTQQGFLFSPIKGDSTLTAEEFEKLPDDEKDRLEKLMQEGTEKLHDLMHKFPRWRREQQGRLKEVARKTMSYAVSHLVEELRDKFHDLPDVLSYLDAVLKDLIESGEALREQPRQEGDLSSLMIGEGTPIMRYYVNLVIDNASAQGAPVVYEDNPTLQNLMGRIDYLAQFGMMITNLTLIKPGALHKANGGYLILDAVKLLTQPFSWDALKRALRSNHIRIESLSQMYGFASSLPLEPEPVPLHLKVVLIGERMHYYLLRELDPEFAELFKVAADFDDDIDRDNGNTGNYARFLANLAQSHKLRPFERSAIARLIEESARVAGDSGKLSVSARRMLDLMQEAEHFAAGAGKSLVDASDVRLALEAQIGRAARVREGIKDQIMRNLLLISLDEKRIGQVNALVIIELADRMFGHPVRVTATARLGDGQVIDIERETDLGGSIHSKGVLILSAFLASRYSRDIPLSLSASLVFEQSYGPVEGDSASLAELCALLSALSEVPIQQNLAITGSVNQHGEVQPIGGVNEKIEGFFDICKARGLTGKQGVIIPESNVQHLMLREDIVAACGEKKFAVYAVKTVDDAIELLTGRTAGRVESPGKKGSENLNYLVARRLQEFSLLRRQLKGSPGKKNRKKR